MKFQTVLKIALIVGALTGFILWETRHSTRSRPSIPQQPTPVISEDYGPPKVTGKLKSSEIDESSGLVAAQTPGLYWTHNDSGDGPYIYAITETGAARGVWKVAGASARDWEDIEAGPGPERGRRYLYVGDIGDNDEKRKDITVYRFPEPVITPADAAVTKKDARLTDAAEAIKLKYPDGPHDAETLLVHPETGDLYIIDKIMITNAAVYKAAAPLSDQDVVMLVKLAELDLPSVLGGVVTGGDVSPDGRRVAICDYLQAYELTLPKASNNFDDIWKQQPKVINIGKRPQGEGIAYRLDGRALLASSEGEHSQLIQVIMNSSAGVSSQSSSTPAARAQ
jgi:hypothetical protein